MADDDNITKLPVQFKKAVPDDRSILRPWEVGKFGGCHHPSFVVDEKLAQVECSVCGASLNPIWVLGQLATEDRRMHDAAVRYREEMRRLDERSRTKCQHCGQMTRISWR